MQSKCTLSFHWCFAMMVCPLVDIIDYSTAQITAQITVVNSTETPIVYREFGNGAFVSMTVILSVWFGAYLKRPAIGRMSLLNVHHQKISNVTKFSRDAEKLFHPGSENGARPATEVDNQWPVSSAKFQEPAVWLAIHGDQLGVWGGFSARCGLLQLS